jgi:RimJ/RimL family protein N-acetyltransferase
VYVNVSLQDGTEVKVRPIRHDDGERLRASHARLSPETRYRRFLGVKPELTAADTRYLVNIDGCDHVALVATLEDEIIAVARFVRLSDDPRAAEFAIVVGDSHQRQGLATRLLTELTRAALERGISRFVATVLSDNVPVYGLMDKIAAGPLHERPLGAVSEVEFALALVPGADRGSAAAPAMIAACAGS